MLPRGVRVLFEDDGLLVLDKPPGMVDVGDKRGMTIESAAVGYLGLPRGAQLPVLTRLEQGASGPVVVAKHRGAAERFRPAFLPSRAPRTYFCVVEGEPPSTEGTVSSHLRVSSRGVVESVPVGEPTGDAPPAITHYRVERTNGELSLLRVRTETDRREQVRCHMAELGCPIIGDRAHSAKRDDLGRLGLHLGEIGFGIRAGDRQKSIRRPVPAGFKAVFDPDANRGAPDEGDAGWDHVAEWYSGLVEKRSDHHDDVVLPGVRRLLGDVEGKTILDVACGDGRLFAYLHDQGAHPASMLGIDLAPTLIEHASGRGLADATFVVGDAQDLAPAVAEAGANGGGFDAACCLLAMMNIGDVGRMLEGVAGVLKPGGAFVCVILHPAFRVPKSSGWEWEERHDGVVQHRRVSRYLRPHAVGITMNPGAVSEGADAVETTTHHRPVGDYLNALARAGFALERVEEWTSQRVSEPGPRADAENAARAEIPLFMAMRAVKAGGSAPTV